MFNVMALAKRQTPLSLNIEEEKKEEVKQEVKPVKAEEPKKVAPKKVKPIEVGPIEVAKPVQKRVNPLSLDESQKDVKVEVKEVIKEVVKYVEVPKEVIKEVEKIVEVPKEVVKEVIKEVYVNKENKEMPKLPECSKNSFVIGFVRKDVMSVLKAKGGSTKDILNEAIVELLKEKYPEDYLKLAKGE